MFIIRIFDPYVDSWDRLVFCTTSQNAQRYDRKLTSFIVDEILQIKVRNDKCVFELMSSFVLYLRCSIVQVKIHVPSEEHERKP